MRTVHRLAATAALLAGAALAAVVVAPPAEAGPPLICHLIEIGDARSLPWGDDAFEESSTYRVERLPDDALELLAPDTPVLVRMETLRRATMYARRRPELGDRLALRLAARVLDGEASDSRDPLAWFDVGYLAACRAQLGGGGVRLEGRPWIDAALRGRADPSMEFAAALTRAMGEGDVERFREHLRHAAAGAADDPLLAKNLEIRFGDEVARIRAEAKKAAEKEAERSDGDDRPR